MKNKLPEFQSVEKCPKCNKNRFVDTGGGETALYDSTERLYRRPDPDIKMLERLDIKCSSCGYEWQESCADYNGKAESV